MPFVIALLCHPAGAYAFLVLAVAGLWYGFETRRFVPTFTGAAAAALTLLAHLHVSPSGAGLACLAAGVALLIVEFRLPTFGAAVVAGLGASVYGSWLLLAPAAGFAMPTPLRLALALAGALGLLAVVLRALRLRTLAAP
jgi:membrane-bound serine protease (ClpP class)